VSTVDGTDERFRNFIIRYRHYYHEELRVTMYSFFFFFNYVGIRIHRSVLPLGRKSYKGTTDAIKKKFRKMS